MEQLVEWMAMAECDGVKSPVNATFSFESAARVAIEVADEHPANEYVFRAYDDRQPVEPAVIAAFDAAPHLANAIVFSPVRTAEIFDYAIDCDLFDSD